MTRSKPAPTHWLRSNEREWTPAHAVFLDTETTTSLEGESEVLRLRCWVARSVNRRPESDLEPVEHVGSGTDRVGLADWVQESTKQHRSTWLFTHNLTFDLVVSDLITELVARGWALGEWSSNERAPWFRLKKGSAGLVLADSLTWIPAALHKVAPLVGIVKPPLPKETAPLRTWLARCRADVDILAAAMLQLMDWWEAAGLGNWTVTGNGCGWNAMRHQVPKRTILVRTGDGGRELERRAIYGGRRDATQWGEVPGGPFVTIDFEAAYPTICANLRLPAKRMDRFESLPPDHPSLGDGAVQVLAEVTVSCNRPRYPLRERDCVWYPVGEFRTVLAGPELLEAKARGELRDVHHGYRYWCDGHLAGWARWVLDLAAGRVDGAPGVAALAGKRWGRSVPGRFAQRIGTAEHFGPAESVGWGVQPAWNQSAGCRAQLVDLGGERYLVTQDQEADDSFPAVLAWVESYCRVRLNRMLDLLGEGAWVACNTDGAVINLERAAQGPYPGLREVSEASGPLGVAGALCDLLAAVTAPLVARPKDSYGTMWLAGPQSMTLDGTSVMSGIPAAARPGDDGRLHAHVWPGLKWQMAQGDRSGYVRPLQAYTVPAVTVRRWALDTGGTVPVTVHSTPDGINVFETWAERKSTVAGPGLAEVQARPVAALLSGRAP